MTKKKRGKKTVKPKQTKRTHKTTRKYKKPKVIYKKEKLRGKPKGLKGLAMDKSLKALPPGKRRSKTGKIYYEYRSNHADLNPRKRL